MFSSSDNESDEVSLFSQAKTVSVGSPTHPIHRSQQSKKHSSSQSCAPDGQLDSLDVFMSTLQRESHPNSKPLTLDTFEGSEDEQINAATQVLDSDNEEKSSFCGILSPVLSPVKFDIQTLPQVERHVFNDSSLKVVNSEAVSSQLNRFNASVRNGSLLPSPSFHHLSPPAPKALADFISDCFSSPTPIQAVSFPYTFSSRDIVAIAQTGSGKTVAYAFPLITHVLAQPGSSRAGRGPVGIVIVPTRELAIQVSQVVDRFGKTVGVFSCCVVGGVSKYEQFKQIRDSGAGIIVCTPGRLIDMLRMRACQMTRCSFVVIDEADRMLDMGFGPQVRTLLSQIRPDSQRALFSATFPGSVRQFGYDILDDPVTISMSGSSSIWFEKDTHTMVNDNVKERYFSFPDDNSRREWMVERLPALIQDGLVIIFCTTRGDAAFLANVIREKEFPAICTHGETEQSDRELSLSMFRAGEVPILVTTDMSARGLDIDEVRNVVNYGCAKSWEWHVHRVGRTGRASQIGNAYTLMVRSSSSDISFAREAVALLSREKRNVPSALALTASVAREENRTDRRHGKTRRNWLRKKT